jgi:hypothetical protein
MKGKSGVARREPSPREIFGRTAKKSEPDDLPGHAQSSRAHPSAGPTARTFKPPKPVSGAKKRLKGVMI